MEEPRLIFDKRARQINEKCIIFIRAKLFDLGFCQIWHANSNTFYRSYNGKEKVMNFFKGKAMKVFAAVFLLSGIASTFMAGNVFAGTAAEIDKDVDRALEIFTEMKGSDNVLTKAKGLLVFPIVLKAGIGIGGEYGEGALRIDGKTVDYYNTAAASLGFQLGGQKKTIIIAFLDADALRRFRESLGWKIGADASVAVIVIGAGGTIDSASLNEPIVAVVFGQKGLMYNLTLEGAKVTKINK